MNDSIQITLAQLDGIMQRRLDRLNTEHAAQVRATEDVFNDLAFAIRAELSAAPAAEPAPDVEPKAKAPKPAPAARPPTTAKVARYAGRKSGPVPGTKTAQAIDWIRSQAEEFSTSQFGNLAQGFGLTYSGATSILAKLQTARKITRVRQGWWTVDDQWRKAEPVVIAPKAKPIVIPPPSAKELEYRAAREAMNINVPEIEGAAPTQH